MQVLAEIIGALVLVCAVIAGVQWAAGEFERGRTAITELEKQKEKADEE